MGQDSVLRCCGERMGHQAAWPFWVCAEASGGWLWQRRACAQPHTAQSSNLVGVGVLECVCAACCCLGIRGWQPQTELLLRLWAAPCAGWAGCAPAAALMAYWCLNLPTRLFRAELLARCFYTATQLPSPAQHHKMLKPQPQRPRGLSRLSKWQKSRRFHSPLQRFNAV